MATHIMTALGLRRNEVINSTYLARSLNTNPVVVRRILGELRKAGLVHTHAGRSGGSELAQSPQSITLYEIFSAVEDSGLFAYNPNDPNRQCALSCEIKSVLTPVFLSVTNAVSERLKGINLADLIAKLARKM
ncbi:putative transcriptional regulator, BadM/Rrf2 family [Nitrospira lenta]|uniref:Putative transcriptional regulator, BadM/Rrf2 family n=2 Tax=Nitrospira lenta TaxID=1436998 RepID=A0A330L2Y2_9BACT|nr:putative transcriptional regulator, BadM/Rrf2 family [Nitrospira lenta]